MRCVVISGAQAAALSESGGDDVERRATDVTRHLLLESRDARARFADDASIVGRERGVEHLHQRTLAGAVAPEEADALSALHVKGGVIEDGRSAERDADFLNSQQCHARKLSVTLYPPTVGNRESGG